MPSDEALRDLFCKACAHKYAASLMRPDAYCLDMCGWDGDQLKAELLGFRWHEFIDPQDMPRVKLWILDADAPNPCTYRGLDPTSNGRMYDIAVSKVSSPGLRLIIGCERQQAKRT